MSSLDPKPEVLQESSIPIQQPKRKSKRKYMPATEAEQLILLGNVCNKTQSVIFDLMQHGKFNYPKGEVNAQIHAERMQLAAADLICILKLMMESGLIDRQTIRKSLKARLKVMLANSHAQGSLSEGRLTELNRRLL